MELFAFKINENPIGTVVTSWESNQLSGNTPFITSTATTVSGYENITSIKNWYVFGINAANDYLHMREQVRDIISVVGWSGTSNEERDILIDLYLDDPNIPTSGNNTNKIVHLMTTNGLSQVDSIQYLQDVFGEHHIKDIAICKLRADSSKLYSVVAKYLTLDDGRDFFQTVRNLYIDFKEQAIKGTNNGTVGVGIFDYIENTVGTIYENAGLNSKGYIMQNGDPDETNFISELMDVFRNGNI